MCAICVKARTAAPDRGSLSLGKLDVHGIARLREIVLEVIDAGDPVLSHVGDIREWFFYHKDEDYANEQRLLFCDAIATRIAEEAK